MELERPMQQPQKSTSNALRAESRAENRAAMPEVARIVDEFREMFGPGVRVVYALENGVEKGIPSSSIKQGR